MNKTKSTISLEELINEYKYEPELTTYLDQLGTREMSSEDLLKITLWKVARYPHFDDKLRHQLNSLAYIKDLSIPKEKKLAEDVLYKLLKCKGIRLPMASTYLRFRNPHVFQIIDRHMWKQIMFGEYGKYKESNDYKHMVFVYFQYLEKLREMCKRDNVDFFYADRIYYLADKRKNN